MTPARGTGDVGGGSGSQQTCHFEIKIVASPVFIGHAVCSLRNAPDAQPTAKSSLRDGGSLE